jgi:hypothetical protein
MSIHEPDACDGLPPIEWKAIGETPEQTEARRADQAAWNKAREEEWKLKLAKEDEDIETVLGWAACAIREMEGTNNATTDVDLATIDRVRTILEQRDREM